MSYLMIAILSALVGVVAGKYVNSDQGSAIDAVAGVVGGCLAVAVSRMMSVAAAGYMVSILVSITGAFIALYVVRQMMKAKPVVAPVRKRRY